MHHSNVLSILSERRLLIFFLLVFMMLFIPTVAVFADTDEESDNNLVNYTVQAVLPEENQNPDVSYFDLLVEPGEELELSLLIHNTGEELLEIDVLITDASTNRNGLIIYDENEDRDETLEVPITELVELEEDRVTVPAGESKEVTAHLTVPEEEFDGIKLGGFKFQEAPSEDGDEDEESGAGIQILNEYVYTIGLVIHQNDEEITPELEMTSLESEVENHRTAVRVNLQNPTPTIIRHLSIVAEIYDDNDELVLG